MNPQMTFVFTYSAKDNKEIQEIRNKYLPREETKLEELKRLDDSVQRSGVTEALCAGIGGALIFGFGLCLAMKVIGNGALTAVLGVIIGVVGIAGMIAAYPIHRKVLGKTREKLAPRILELSAELTGEKTML